MQAAVYYGPGDVRIEQVRDPGPLGPNEVMLRVSMVSLCGTDTSQFEKATMVPLTHPHPASGHCGPVILGHEVVGTIVALGTDVNHLSMGMRVVPGAGMWCGTCRQCRTGRINICQRYYLYGIHANGGLAEYATFPAKMCVPVPERCSDAAAAMAQPCAVALHALSRVAITDQQTVVLFGAGNIGSLLLACLHTQKIFPHRLIVVDIDQQCLQRARQLGASHVVHTHKDEDAMRTVMHITEGQGAEVVIDAAGTASSINQALAVTAPGGKVLLVGIPSTLVALPLAEAIVQEKDLLTTNGEVCTRDLLQALTLLTETDLARQIGYRVLTLDRLVEKGLRQQGAEKVIIAVHVTL